MYKSSFAHKLDQEFKSIFSIQPNDLGNKQLTLLYKYITRPLKQMPFVYLVPLSVLFSIAVYFVLGNVVINLVSLLQYGF